MADTTPTIGGTRPVVGLLATDVALRKDRKRGRRKRAQAAAVSGAAEPATRSRKKRAKEVHKRIVLNEDAEPGSLLRLGATIQRFRRGGS